MHTAVICSLWNTFPSHCVDGLGGYCTSSLHSEWQMKTETSMAVRLDDGAYQGWQLDSENCLIVVSHTGVFNPCCTVETHLGLLRCTFAWVPSKPGETEYQGAELGHLYLVKSPQLDRNHREIPAHTYESVEDQRCHVLARTWGKGSS